MTGPPAHPLPPADFSKRDLLFFPSEEEGEEFRLVKGTRLYRVHKVGKKLLYFGRSGDNRWDDPHKKYGVLYAGLDMYCAFIETFGHATGQQLIDRKALDAKGMAYVVLKQSLRVADLTGRLFARLGADNRLCDGDIEIAQIWSRAFYDHPQRPDGICYRARHDASRYAFAIFDRASNKLRASRFIDRFSNPLYERILGDLLDRYEFGL